MARAAAVAAVDLALLLHLRRVVAATAVAMGTTGPAVVLAGDEILGPAAVLAWGAADQCA